MSTQAQKVSATRRQQRLQRLAESIKTPEELAAVSHRLPDKLIDEIRQRLGVEQLSTYSSGRVYTEPPRQPISTEEAAAMLLLLMEDY